MSNDKLPVDKIKQLSEILKDQDLTEIEIEMGDLKIKVRKESSVVHATAPIAQPAPVSAAPATASASAKTAPSADVFEVKSPMVGTYYASPSPDAPAFVKVGDKIKKGDPLCIIEAMKLMNELPAELSGEVLEILVNNADAISYGQVIMKIKKS
jgi:acetyl-CoA carboxylase biotin carboxyl carrier protein